MEEHANIRRCIREILREIHYQANYIPFVSTNNGQFPYNQEDIAFHTPEELAQETIQNNQEKSFSDQELKLGSEIERRIHPNFNTLEINNIVLKNLNSDNLFYSKLKQPK